MPFDPSCIEVVDFLDCLDIRNVSKATENEYRFSCPYPAHDTGDETPSAYMNAQTTSFFCHSCHAKGNAVSFTADILGVSQIEATRMLKQRYQPGGIDPFSRSMSEEIRKIINARHRNPEKRERRRITDRSMSRYCVNWDAECERYAEGKATPYAKYMFERGFSPYWLDIFEFGWSEKSQRIILPVRDVDGWIVGVKARAIDGRKPKYLNLREDDIEPFMKNDVVFGLYEAVTVRAHRKLIVVEGEFNVVAMFQHGYSNTVSINGSYFGQRQVKLLRKHADEVTLFFDSDNAGRDATEALSEALRPFMRVYICPDHHGDPAEMHKASVDACIADRVSLTRRRLAVLRS